MNISRALVLAIAFGMAAASARANFYTKVGALYNTPTDLKIDNAAAFRSSLKSSLGYTASIGYKASLLRAEVEVQTMKNAASGASNNAGGGLTASGAIKEYSAFVNGYLDVPSFFGLAPYVGVGLGEARIDLDNFSAVHGASNVVQLSGRGKANGYQIMGGLQFHVFGKATVNAGYRIFHKGSFDAHNFATNVRQTVNPGIDKLFEIGLAWGF